MVEQNSQISIGILAYNEAAHIGRALQTLFMQDAFEKYSIEVIVVPNGCTDDTAALARQCLMDHQHVWSARGSAKVQALAKAGKANAWNFFVHELSAAQASILFLMDADIEFLQSDSISSMIVTLKTNSDAIVCVDRPIKDIEHKADRTFFQRLLLAATPEIDPTNVPLCGQLYCALSEQLRLITLPSEITIEDGFLRALLLTDGFTEVENRKRIVWAQHAAHKFYSASSLLELFKHEKWIVTGSIVNMMLFKRFGAECTSGCNAMTVMKGWQDRDQNWLPKYISSEVHQRGWRILPRFWWTRRWTCLNGLSLAGKLRRLPVVALATIIDITIFGAAIRDVRKGRAFYYWDHKLD